MLAKLYLHSDVILSDMKWGQDYNWDSIKDIGQYNFVCGFCGTDIASRHGFNGARKNARGILADEKIYLCHNCGRPNYFDCELKQIPKFKGLKVKFSDPVNLISPKFVSIYNQAQTAEDDGLDEIAGPGFGKALEFLVKDYLIKKLPKEVEEIKKLTLHDCIEVKVDNPKIKKLSAKAKLIRNDEMHYERKYVDQDLKDLKNLINATCSWIDLESYTDQIGEEV